MSDKYFSAIAKMKIKVKELVYASENSELKEVVKHVEDRLKEKADSFIDVAINEAILEVLEEPFIVDDETFEAMFIRKVYMAFELMDMIKLRSVFSVALKGFEDRVNAKFYVPKNAVLSDVIYAALVAIGAEACHSYLLDYKDEVYTNLEAFDALSSDDHTIDEIGWVLNEKAKLVYDFGENYEFNLTYLEDMEVDNDADLFALLAYKGQILEDNRLLLEAYLKDPEADFYDEGKCKDIMEAIEFEVDADRDYLYDEFDGEVMGMSECYVLDEEFEDDFDDSDIELPFN